jgi:hypothetical protein
MNLFAPFKPMFMEFGRVLAFGCIFITGWLVAYAAQDVVPNPRAWFWSLLWVICFHLVITGCYFRRVGHWSRWAGLAFCRRRWSFSASCLVELIMTRPNKALQRTRRGRRGCTRHVPCAGSLSLGRSVFQRKWLMPLRLL